MSPPISHDHDAPERRKATLYCWECDHASPVDGDWIYEIHERATAYVCPDCSTVITERPRNEADFGHRSQPTTAWSRVVRTSVTVWRASFDVGFAGMFAMAYYLREDH